MSLLPLLVREVRDGASRHSYSMGHGWRGPEGVFESSIGVLEFWPGRFQ